MATATLLTRNMDLLRTEIADLRKTTPSIGTVHINRPLGSDDEDDDAPIVKTISGSSDISLNAKGIKLAKKLAERIAAKGCFDIIYSSTLPRGIETVQPILEACSHCIYAEATNDLVPWRLGAYEGQEPQTVHSQITTLIENPDEVPPGTGNDGLPGESFNASKSRQLGFFRRIMNDWRNDPTLKIGVQVHSRGEDLFIAWVADGAPDDYAVDTKDVIDPDDQPHASVMRWAGKDEVKEVDLDSDDMLKGGVYLVLHSLTNDDGDSGNPELAKGGPGSGPHKGFITPKGKYVTNNSKEIWHAAIAARMGYKSVDDALRDGNVRHTFSPSTGVHAYQFVDKPENIHQALSHMRGVDRSEEVIVDIHSPKAKLIEHGVPLRSFSGSPARVRAQLSAQVKVKKANPYHDEQGHFSSADGKAVITHETGINQYHEKTLTIRAYHPDQNKPGWTTPVERYASTPEGMTTANIIGRASFVQDWNGGPFKSDSTIVHEDFRRQGVGTAMYAHAIKEGYDIAPSGMQFEAGAKLWEGLRRAGVTKAETPRVLFHGTSAEDFDEFADRPTYLTDDEDHALMFATDPTAGGGAGAGDHRVLYVSCAPGTSKDITAWVRPEFDKGVDGDVDTVVERMGAEALAEGHSYVEFDHPSAHHDADSKTFRSVVALKPTRDLQIQKGGPGSGPHATGVHPLSSAQSEHDRLKDHPAREQHASETAHNAFSRDVDKFGDRVGKLVQQNTSALMSAKVSGGTSALKAAKGQMESGREMLNEAARLTGDERMWRVDTALSSFHSALLFTSKVLGSKWVGKRADEVLTKRVYMPPIEVHRAAKSAWDAGMSVVGITDALAESRGLDYANVQMIADFFAASESTTAPNTTRNAYGGVNAAKWAAKVIAKSERVWESWIGIDLDGTLAMPSQSYDGTAIGKPIPKMLAKVKALLASGKKVRIFTARVADDPDGKIAEAIKVWCREHIGQELLVTNEKDPGMVELWDDRAHNPDEIVKAGSGVMVAFMLDESTANKLKVDGGEDPKDMHVTLAYLGKLDALDMSSLPGLEKAIKAYAAEHAPVSGTIDGPVRFSAKPQTEGRDVVVAAFCNPGIQEFRAGLVDAIKAAGITVPRVFDYRPHVCIKYIPTNAPMPVQRIAPTPVTFNAITLSVGGARKSYPLSGSVVKYSPDQPRDDKGRFGSGSGKDAKNIPSRAEQDKAIGEIKSQLTQIDKLTGGKGTDAYVLANGKPYYMDAKSFEGPRGTERLCYMNSYQAATRGEGLTYVEGQVNVGPLSIAHAWTVDKQGNVRDPTLKAPSGKAVEPRGYFGVPFDNEYLMKTALKTGVYGVISHTNRDLFKKFDDIGKYSPDQPRDDHGRFGAGDHAGTERDRIRAVLNTSDNDPAVKEAEVRNLNMGDSRLMPGVLDAAGHYTPEADAENRSIANSFLKPDAKPADGEKPSAIFMVGKPGAGKSTTLKALRDTLPNAVTVNSDDIKEKLPGYTPDQAAAYHERSCDIARSYLTPEAIHGGYNIVFDMTDNSERLLQSINALKGAGYKVGLIHSDVSDATSAERVYNRFKESGRYVSVRTALSYSGRPKLAYDLAKPHVDQYREYDQNGKSPKLTDSGGRGIF